MQADAYAGFGKLYEANRKGGPIIEAACWAHCRRKFFDLARLSKAPIAAEAVIATAKLNDIDPQAWFADVLARLPDHPARRIHELLPWNWRPHNVAHAA
jgi:transposase IS66-like protein/transposase IS66 family protein